MEEKIMNNFFLMNVYLSIWKQRIFECKVYQVNN